MRRAVSFAARAQLCMSKPLSFLNQIGVAIMKRSRQGLLAGLAVAIVALSLAWADDKPATPDKKPLDAPAPSPEKPKIQLAILLDTSNSMDGLIDQARTQLWKIVNEFATAKRDGVRPELEVGLFEYGNNSIDAGANYVRLVVPLTDDLDKVSDELFKLKTNGGEEYCGAVIDAATKRLKWSNSDKVFKAIFVAGNEPFTQGKMDPFKACSDAVKLGITVNTIHCGSFAEGVNTGWQKGSTLADGSYVAIDQDQPRVAIKTPVDEKLIKLGDELNKTYVFFGTEEARQGRDALQRAQDANAAKQSQAAAAERVSTKGGELYNNSRFDLVDGVNKKEVKLEELKDDQLPDNLKGKSLEEKQKFVEAQAKKRKELQDEIKTLTAQREEHIAKANVAAAKAGKAAPAAGLDAAVIKTVREQAAKKSFEFDKK
jgi:hypothetical protein